MDNSKGTLHSGVVEKLGHALIAGGVVGIVMFLYSCLFGAQTVSQTEIVDSKTTFAESRLYISSNDSASIEKHTEIIGQLSTASEIFNFFVPTEERIDRSIFSQNSPNNFLVLIGFSGVIPPPNDVVQNLPSALSPFNNNILQISHKNIISKLSSLFNNGRTT